MEELNVELRDFTDIKSVLRYWIRQKEKECLLYEKARLKGIHLMFLTSDFKLLFTRISLLFFCRLKLGLFVSFLFFYQPAKCWRCSRYVKRKCHLVALPALAG